MALSLKRFVLLISISVFWDCSTAASSDQPNIIFLLIDDLGWNDVSYNGGSDFPTPNLEELHEQSIRLTNYYVQHFCTPTRSALMTGRYPMRDGLQQWIIRSTAPYGMPLELQTIPEMLKDLGYSTHMLGKWHLGFFDAAYTPTNRGFDTFYGFYGDEEDYFTKSNSEFCEQWYEGYDFRHQEDTYLTDEYSTWFYANKTLEILQNAAHSEQKEPFFLYWSSQAAHMPFQAPKEYVDSFGEIISSEGRVNLAAVVSVLDESLGEVVKYMKSEESGRLWDDTILIVSSDNGGSVTEEASNFPLRGGKKTLWEGGIKATAFIAGGWFNEVRYGQDMDALMHVTDWMPTIMDFAGLSNHQVNKLSKAADIDGKNQADNIILGETDKYSPRDVILLNILPKGEDGSCASSYCGAMRFKDFKLIVGRDMYMKLDDEETGSDSDRAVQLCDNGWCENTAARDPNFRPQHSISCHVKSNGKQQNYKYPALTTDDCLLNGMPCMFDLSVDPCEYHNIFKSTDENSIGLIHRLEMYAEGAVAPLYRDYSQIDALADPQLNGGYWGPWLDEMDLEEDELTVGHQSSVKGSVLSQILVIVIPIVAASVFLLMFLWCMYKVYQGRQERAQYSRIKDDDETDVIDVVHTATQTTLTTGE